MAACHLGYETVPDTPFHIQGDESGVDTLPGENFYKKNSMVPWF